MYQQVSQLRQRIASLGFKLEILLKTWKDIVATALTIFLSGNDPSPFSSKRHGLFWFNFFHYCKTHSGFLKVFDCFECLSAVFTFCCHQYTFRSCNVFSRSFLPNLGSVHVPIIRAIVPKLLPCSLLYPKK